MMPPAGAYTVAAGGGLGGDAAPVAGSYMRGPARCGSPCATFWEEGGAAPLPGPGGTGRALEAPRREKEALPGPDVHRAGVERMRWPPCWRRGPAGIPAPGPRGAPQQLDMAGAVASALEDGSFLVVEAGTGWENPWPTWSRGSSTPAVSQSPLVVSTYTRNLQEAAFPPRPAAARRTLGTVEFSLLKGRGTTLPAQVERLVRSLAEGDPAFYFTALPPAWPTPSWPPGGTHLYGGPGGDLPQPAILLPELLRESPPAPRTACAPLPLPPPLLGGAGEGGCGT